MGACSAAASQDCTRSLISVQYSLPLVNASNASQSANDCAGATFRRATTRTPRDPSAQQCRDLSDGASPHLPDCGFTIYELYRATRSTCGWVSRYEHVKEIFRGSRLRPAGLNCPYEVPKLVPRETNDLVICLHT
jgi:hypothetical protein